MTAAELRDALTDVDGPVAGRDLAPPASRLYSSHLEVTRIDIPVDRRTAALDIVTASGHPIVKNTPYCLVVDTGNPQRRSLITTRIPAKTVAVVAAETLLTWWADPTLLRLPKPWTPVTYAGIVTVTTMSTSARDRVFNQLASSMSNRIDDGTFGDTPTSSSPVADTLAGLLSDHLHADEYAVLGMRPAAETLIDHLDLAVSAHALHPNAVSVPARRRARTGERHR